MEYKTFPLMGFPGETNKPDGSVVYQCYFPGARIALWIIDVAPSRRYEVNIYKPFPDDAHRDDTLTDHRDRFHMPQNPITIHCVMEAQLVINYLIQKYLPTEVTDDTLCSDSQPREAVE